MMNAGRNFGVVNVARLVVLTSAAGLLMPSATLAQERGHPAFVPARGLADAGNQAGFETVLDTTDRPTCRQGTGYSPPPPRSRNIPIVPHSRGSPASRIIQTRMTVSAPMPVNVGVIWANQFVRNRIPKNTPP